MPEPEQHSPGRDWIALTLAIGMATAFNLITIAVLVAAWYRGQRTGDYALSENATQVLIAGFGGFIGILGGYVGGRAVESAQRSQASTQQQQQPTVDVERVETVNISREPEPADGADA